jgi:alkylation response protein AidB-like acyl-CoA dehydrogenase
MDIAFSSEETRFREEARSWLGANIPTGLLPMDTPEGAEQHRAWEHKLYAARWSAVTWPVAFGGRGASIFEWLVFEEEYYRARAPRRISQNGILLLGPTMIEHGSPEQKARFLPRIASGEDIWCQGWSEPGAGSDLAGIRSQATRVDGGWRLNGQKIWTSRGTVANWCFGIFRTTTSGKRFEGLTYFLIPLDSPGVEVRPIPQLDGIPSFAEVFFDNVFITDDLVLGGIGNGWNVAMSTAGSERGLTLRSPGRFLEPADRLLRLLAAPSAPGGVAYASADRAAKAWIGAQAYRWSSYWAASKMAAGHTLGAETSCNKVFWSELDVEIQETALDLLGGDAELLGEDANDTWLDDFIFAIAGPIYGGTNEIQRNIIAQRILGLPRA